MNKNMIKGTVFTLQITKSEFLLTVVQI